MNRWQEAVNPETVRGYTLLELLAAMATLGVILALLFSATGMTSLAWRENASAIDTFQQARSAFSGMTLRLGRATLNNYRDYFDTEQRDFTYPIFTPGKMEYRQRSELNFVCGRAGDLIADETTPHPAHAVFFQAPLGRNGTSEGSGRSALNQCAYYIEYGSDEKWQPSFAVSAATARYRYRLCEAVQSSEKFSLYQYPAGNLWLKDFVSGQLSSCAHVLAENIVALVLLPQRYPGDTGIAPNYAYDSRAWQSSRTTLADLTQNRLPPLVQVTMVVVDENSARRMQTADPGGFSNLVGSGLFQNAANYAVDLKTLEDALKPHCRYRIFQTTVALASSSWSE
jgi:uncharacterized protein (TIGR02599 family)